MKKICSKCQIEKELSEFFKKVNRKYGVRSECKLCSNQYYKLNKDKINQKEKQYRFINKEKIKQHKKLYNVSHKDTIKSQKRLYYHTHKEEFKTYYEDNKQRIKQKRKLYYNTHKDLLKQRSNNCKEHTKSVRKEYYNKNKSIIRAKAKQHYNNNIHKERQRIKQYRDTHKQERNQHLKIKRQINIAFKIAHYLRSRTNRAAKNKCKAGSAVRDLGCTPEQLKTRLESLFKSGMSWDNYGRYGWHIDHIIPLTSVNLENREEFLKVAHYTNLQPLWWHENISKGGKIL